MSDLIPFSFENHQIRIVTTDDGDLLFVAKDVATALGYANTADAVRTHCKRAKSLKDIGCAFHAPQSDQALTLDPQTKLIPESDLYRLTLKSQLESADKFQDWVVEEVIPSIRKTGKYEATPKFKPSVKPVDALKIVPIAARAVKALGFTGNQATLSIDRAVKAITGESPLSLMGQTHLLADQRGRTYTPTDLGKMADPAMSGQKVNKAIEDGGMQVRDIKGEWTPLEKAAGLFEWVDTGKRHSDGVPVKQLKWFVEVLDRLGIAYRLQEDAA